MTTASTDEELRPPRSTGLRRVSAFLHRHNGIRVTGLVAAPMLWLVLIYLVALLALFITAFWTVDFGGNVTRDWTLDNFKKLFEVDVYRTVVVRTILVAVSVTVIDAVLALPIAFYMAKIARPSVAKLLVVALLMPLWASYLVKAYSWRSVLSEEGILNWLLAPFGIEGPGYGLPAVVITLSYLWLPYVILPIFAGFERVPASLLEASADLGGKPGRTMFHDVLPMLRPSIIAGAIFAFSLSLGDYITVNIVGGANQLLGNLVFTNVGAANNLPLAAAISLIPIAIMAVFLFGVRRTGALNNL